MSKNSTLVFLIFIIIFNHTVADYPADINPNPTSCFSDSDCPNFYYPTCDPGTHQCVHSCTNTGCDRFSGSGQGVCTGDRCIVLCTYPIDPDCIAMRGYCNPSNPNRCRQCLQDSDCTDAGYPGTVYCDQTTIPGFGVCSSCPATGCPSGTQCVNYKCAECTSDSQCQLNTPAKPNCQETFLGNYCRECYLIEHCTNPSKSLCSNSYTCVVCGGDGDCARLTATPYCIGSGCVQCTGDGHCSGTTPYCVNNVCQACTTSYCGTRFGSAAPACKTATGTCVRCVGNGDCGGTTPYCVGNTCQGCTTAYCNSNFASTTPACRIDTGVCVGCTGNGDCSGTTPYCVSGTCQACTTSYCVTQFGASYPSSSTCRVDTGYCVQCAGDGNCPASGTPYCNTASNLCGSCTSLSTICSSLFSGNSPPLLACKTDTGICVQCVADGDCGGTTPYCVGNTCQGCTTAYCNSNFASTTPACRTDTGVCVGCVGNGDCGGTTPYCVGYTCQACTTSYCMTQSGTSWPALQACRTDTGVCVQCTADGNCPSTGAPYCNAISNICQSCNEAVTICSSRFSGSSPPLLACKIDTAICVECVGNGYCGGTTPYCIGNACQGCTASYCSSNFPLTTPVCRTDTGTCVQCVSNGDCGAPTPYCLGNTCQACTTSYCTTNFASTTPACRTDTGFCVQCIGDADCPITGFPYCNTASNVCKSCNDDSTICSGRFSGYSPPLLACRIDNGVCVQCVSDSECGGTTPYCVSNICQACTTSYCGTRYGTSFPALSACRADTGFCVQCTGDGNCPVSGTPYCVGNTCQACTTSYCGTRFGASYPASSACRSDTGLCVQCTGDGNCPTSGVPYCNTVSNLCKSCNDDITTCSSRFSGNSPPLLACKTDNGVCVQCISDGNCGGTTPYCVGNICQACTTSYCGTRYGSSFPALAACRVDTGFCVQCLGDGNCPASGTPYCHSISNICEACSSSICSNRFSTSTPTKLACESSTGICKECTGDSFCISSPAKAYCIGDSCYGCTFSSSICPGRFSTNLPPLIVCNIGTDICVECQANTDCPYIDKAYCNLGPAACQPCFDDSQCYHLAGKNKCYLGSCYTYQEQCSPHYEIKVSQNSNIFPLKFPSALVSQINIMTSLSVSIENIDPSEYTYILTKSTTTKYFLTFTFDETIPATALKLTLPCPPQPGYLYGDIHVSFNMEKVLYTTAEVQSMVTILKAITKVTIATTAGFSFSTICSGGNTAILWTLINLLQAFYYLAFINVEYPANVQPFFEIFLLGNFNFVPNPTGWVFPDIDDESLYAPQKFLENDVNGLFYQTAGNMFLLWAIVFLGYVLSSLFLRFTRNMPKLIKISAEKTRDNFEWSGVFRTLIASYTQLTMTSLLQVQVLTYDSKLFYLSSIAGIVFVILGVVVPLVTYLVIYKYHGNEIIMKTKLATLIEEYKPEGIPKYFNVFFLLRRLIMTLSLVFLQEFPYVQINVLILSCFCWICLLWLFSPYEGKFDYTVNLSSELLFLGIHVLILLLIHGDATGWLNDVRRLDVGWGILGCCGVILFEVLISSMVQQYFALKNLLQLLKKVFGKKTKEKAEKLSLVKGNNKEILQGNNIVKRSSRGDILNKFSQEKVKLTDISGTTSKSFSVHNNNPRETKLKNSNGKDQVKLADVSGMSNCSFLMDISRDVGIDISREERFERPYLVALPVTAADLQLESPVRIRRIKQRQKSVQRRKEIEKLKLKLRK